MVATPAIIEPIKSYAISRKMIPLRHVFYFMRMTRWILISQGLPSGNGAFPYHHKSLPYDRAPQTLNLAQTEEESMEGLAHGEA
jgi:hypothetical protein